MTQRGPAPKMLMASLRDPYAGVGVGMLASGLAASQLAQLNHLMLQQQQQQQQQQQHGLPLGQPAMGHQPQPPQPHSPPLPSSMSGAPPECQSPPISRTYTYKKVSVSVSREGRALSLSQQDSSSVRHPFPWSVFQSE